VRLVARGRGADGTRVVAGEDVGVGGDETIGQEVAKLALGPALGGEVQIGARIHAVCDAGADDGENVGRTLAAEIFPGKKPVTTTKDELA